MTDEYQPTPLRREFLATGSRAQRLWKCPASAAIPGIVDVEAEAASEPARNRGKDVHAFLQVVRKIGVSAALAQAPKDLRDLLEAIEVNNLPTHLSTEVALAVDWGTGMVLRLGENLATRDYGPLIRAAIEHLCCDLPAEKSGPMRAELMCGRWIPFTLDVIGIEERPDGIRRGYVGDYKTGFTKYPAPDIFAQTMLGAVALVSSLFQCDEVVVELIHIWKDGSHHPQRARVDDWAVRAWQDEFKRACQLAEEYIELGDLNQMAFSVGAWCDHCPAWLRCPAQVSLVRAIPDELRKMGVEKSPSTGELEPRPGALNVDNAAEAWMTIERIEAVLALAKQQICSLSAVGEIDIPLPDGRVIGRTQTTRREVDAKRALPIVEKRYGREAAAEAFELATSLSAIKTLAASKRAKGEKIETRDRTGVFDILERELEGAGAIKLNVNNTVRPYKPRKRLPVAK